MKLKTTLIIIFVVLGGIAVWLNVNKSHKDPEKSKTDYEMTADNLFEEFDQNLEEANKKYLGAIIEVNGTLIEIMQGDKTVPPTIILANTNENGFINCEMDIRYAEQIEDLNEGQEVTVKGTCEGFLMDVTLGRCIIINTK